MEKVEKKGEILNLKHNKFIGNVPKLIGSKIIFKGENNIFFCDKNVILNGCNLTFNGDNSLVFLSSNCHEYKINVNIFNNSVLYFGTNNYINETMNILISEEKNVVIGNTGLFSLDIWMRVSDAHAIYETENKKRINPSKSIYLGDYVWIGQSSMILKGTKIGSGSVIAGKSVVAGKTIASNTCWGGNPARKIYDNIFFENPCVNNWSSKEIKEKMISNSESFIFKDIKEEKKSFEDIELNLKNIISSKDKLKYLIENIRTKNFKNRFFI